MPLAVLSTNDLCQVEKPAQYLGGERGSILKDQDQIDFNFCLAFPDTYEVGMSHVGIQILYDLINRDPKVWAERVYQPLPDMENLLRRKGVPLASLEGKRPLYQFDVVGFSLQYELCMTGILSMLDLGRIPLLASTRVDGDPLIIGGGPVCYHPEPFADFFDAFLVGDGEELVPEFIELMRALKKKRANRAEMLDAIAHIDGIYVPALFKPLYSQTGKFYGLEPLRSDYTSVRRRIIPSLENAPYPENPIVPNVKAVHDRLSVEVMRGCVRGCRFCQAGYLYRPQRERKPEDVLRIVQNSLENTGYEELSLLSLSTADYCGILPLLSALKERFAVRDQLAISFPSTRVDALTPELLQEVQPVRRSGFTVAPEAGTQRLRDVINKGVTDDELMEMCRNVFKLGWNSIKLYFMIGLPTETDEDIAGIVDIARRAKAIAGHRKEITVSASTFVPKPHTPFQWANQISEGETKRKQQYLFRELKKLRVSFRYHDAFSSFLEGVFARGDRQLGRVILKAYQIGCRMEGWVEKVKNDLWLRAFEETGIDPHHYLHERSTEEPLPWDQISCDIPKRYFLKEWQRAVGARTTPDCLTQSCSVCGACDYDAVRNVLFDRQRTEARLNIVDPPWEPIIALRAAGHTTGLLDKVAVPADDHNAVTPSRSGRYELKEYLKTEVDLGHPSLAGPDSAPTFRVRMQYTKLGNARFAAHLELASLFFRATRRAGLPVAFSRGFTPRSRFAFGPPLQLGVESTCEYVDIFLNQPVNLEDLRRTLNSELPEGVQILDCQFIEVAAGSIQDQITEQRYSATPALGNNYSRAYLAQLKTLESNWQAIEVERVRKRSKSVMPLGSAVRALAANEAGLNFVIAHWASAATLKPLEVVGAATTQDAFAFDVRKIGVVFKDTPITVV